MNTLYTPGTMIFKLREQFLKFLSGLGKPMRQHLLTLAFAILALNGFQSVKASYDRFMSRISARRLKSYYYALSQGDISLDVLMNNLVRTALELIDKEGKQAIIISIDDTLVEKFGQAFAYRSKLFDHAAHNGSNYLNGHCFVSLLIAVPIKDKGLSIDGHRLDVCFMEIDMDVMLKGFSLNSQSSGATFCNIYTSDGIALSSTVLGGLAEEDNLLEALAQAEFEPGYSLDQVILDFSEGRRGVVSFSYNGIRETLSYIPVPGTNWLLTYLIRESVISERISAVSDGIIRRSLIQSVLTALVLGAMFAFILVQMRKNSKLALEKETSEAENRIKHQEMEQRLALQEQMLRQKAQQEQQERMINALASDYRSVYYLELDEDRGVCYQSHADLEDGFRVGDHFPYLASVTAYANRYVAKPYLEDFLQFIQPDAIRQGLQKEPVISYRYKVARHRVVPQCFYSLVACVAFYAVVFRTLNKRIYRRHFCLGARVYQLRACGCVYHNRQI